MSSYDIDVAICTSSEYLKYAKVLIKSISVSNSCYTKRIFLLSPDLTPDDLASIETYCECNTHIDVIKLNEDLFEDFSFNDNWPKFILAQPCLHMLLPNDVDRVLSLEVDTIVDGDIMEFYNIDFGSDYAAAAPWCVGFYKTKNGKMTSTELIQDKDLVKLYQICAGSLMLNLKQLRADGIDIQHYLNVVNSEPFVAKYGRHYTQELLMCEAFRGRVTYINPSRYIYNSYSLNEYKQLNLWGGQRSIIHYIDARAYFDDPWMLYFDEGESKKYAKPSYDTPENNLSIHESMSVWWKYAKLCNHYADLLNEMNDRKKVYLKMYRTVKEDYLKYRDEIVLKGMTANYLINHCDSSALVEKIKEMVGPTYNSIAIFGNDSFGKYLQSVLCDCGINVMQIAEGKLYNCEREADNIDWVNKIQCIISLNVPNRDVYWNNNRIEKVTGKKVFQFDYS